MGRKWMIIAGWLRVCAIAWAGDPELAALSDGIVREANRLKEASYLKAYRDEPTDTEMAESLRQLKILIGRLEEKCGSMPVEAGPPLLGTTTAVKDGFAVLYTDAEQRRLRFDRIKVEHISGDFYVRLRDIKIVTDRGDTLVFQAGAGKFYLGDSYEIELPRPLRISEINVRVQHFTGGLRITGSVVPEAPPLPTVFDLGVTNGIKDGIVVLNTKTDHRDMPIRKLRFAHTGGDEYIRFGQVQVTTVEGGVIVLEVPAAKLYPYAVREIELPRPVRIRSVQMYVQHRTEGLLISAVR